MSPTILTVCVIGWVAAMARAGTVPLPQPDAEEKTLIIADDQGVSSSCPDDKMMMSRTCQASMENLRNQYKNALSNLQNVLANTIDEVDRSANDQISPICGRLSLQTPLIRPEDVQECVLSEWSEWSKPYGFGKMARTREILQDGCGCPDADELKQVVDFSKYTANVSRTDVADDFQKDFLNNGSNPTLPRDILIILDSSGSILDEDFKLMKEGLVTMIDLFCGGFGPRDKNNRMAIIQFATNVTIIHDFSENQDPERLKDEVRRLTHYAGNTCTGDAMYVAAEEIFGDNRGVRDFTVKDTLLVTDGQSNCGRDLRYTVQNLLQKQSNVWALGVGIAGNPTAKQEVESVVTDNNDRHIFSLARFSDFKAMVDSIKRTTVFSPCLEIETE